ncbi:hypothetical protein L873DRAFT_1788250 [Choiromyces venosus 120613-1]|uniref:Uncharacterized protein n=1 Tax=Choiromyces venosus 120613-1 TaxID=1336337 RepID=A0A3N4JTD0_9PEZI|nr:hypothetical protein L873DRAFT_1788250 [Choiromyces venosus 120613-1]
MKGTEGSTQELEMQYLWVARVMLSLLEFPEEDSLFELSTQWIDALIQRFTTDGCERSKKQNHIPTLINRNNYGVLRIANGGPFAYIKKETQDYLKDEFYVTTIPSDGEIFSCIHQYQLMDQLERKSQWMNRLSPSKASQLKQLLGVLEYLSALDRLSPISGL